MTIGYWQALFSLMGNTWYGVLVAFILIAIFFLLGYGIAGANVEPEIIYYWVEVG